jgi:hypothetical protein
LARYIERNRHDWWGTTWKFLIFISMIVISITVILPSRGPWWTAAMLFLSFWLYVRLIGQRTAYKCAACGKVFRVSTAVNFFTTGSMGKNPDGTYYAAKMLTCPGCGQRTKARLLKKADQRTARGGGEILK